MQDVTSLVVGAGGCLAAAVTFLFKIILKQGAEVAAQSGRIGKLEGEHKGIKELSAKTLEIVHNAIAERERDS
tara:strand:- start:286 stop:504 length:219 start_codon:yes stop_codon:yes gene_type:complete